MKTLKVFVLIVLLCYQFSYSQGNCIKDCGDNLEKAVYDQYNFESSSDFQNNLSIYFGMNDEQRSEYLQSMSSSTGLGAFYGNFELYFSDRETNNQRMAEYKKLEELFTKNLIVSQKDLLNVFLKVINPQALDAYKYCLDKCPQSGVFVQVDGDRYDTFVVSLIWRPVPSDYNKVYKIKQVQSPGARLIGGVSMYSGADFTNDGLTQTFSRIDPYKESSIVINIENLGTHTVNLPSKETEQQFFEIPIGTIVASTMDFQKFLQQTSKFPYSPSVSKWAPCDGRNVTGSKYANMFNHYVPDLRGQFLRGLNQFYSPGEEGQFANGSDPGHRRNYRDYSYQDYGTAKPHTNFVTNNSGSHTHSVPSTGSEDGWGRAEEGGGDRSIGTSSNGDHSHFIISGGDNETRPINIAVYYYIRIN